MTDAERRLLGAVSGSAHAGPLPGHGALVDHVREHAQQDGDGDRDPHDQPDVHRYRIHEVVVVWNALDGRVCDQ